MKYALGNMLNGAGGLNADGLSLDLQFATDKTLTARKGPTPVFTRASSGTFVGSNGLIQSAGTNVARFDHDPVSLACKGLLIEESRTNLVFPSDTLTTQTRTVTAVAHTLSFYGTGTVVLSGVAVATVTGTGAYPTRTTLTFTPTAGSLILTVTGSVTQAQLEAGAFPTSYIPTTTASVIRSADVCSISGSAFSGFYNPLEGSFATSQVFNAPATITAGQAVFDVNDTTSLNRTRPVRNATNGFVIYANTVGGTQDVAIAGSTAMIAGAVTKLAGCMKANDFTVYLNNVSQGVDTVSVMQPAPTTFTIGDVSSGSAFRAPINGTISSIRYYRKRLPNAKLASLTV